MPKPDGTAWRLTLIQHVKGFSMAKELSAAAFKRMAMNSTAEARAVHKFAKAANLKGKESRKLSDSWDKRFANSTTGFFDQKKAREMKRVAV